jgi:hypothetical protein
VARVSRERSRGEPVAQLAAQGGHPAEAVRAAGVVGVLRSSVDLPESITGGERRRGTWVRVKGTRNGTGDGQGDLDINSGKVSGAARFTVTAGASPVVEAPSESRMRENRPSGLMRGGVRRSLACASQCVGSAYSTSAFAGASGEGCSKLNCGPRQQPCQQFCS